MSYDLGSVVSVAWAFGQAATVAATVTQPDGTTSAASVSGSSTYTATFTPTQSGRHAIRFVATGAAVGAYVEAFTVAPADPGGIISIAEAKAALNIAASNTTHDEELRAYIDAATPVIEEIAGPVVRASKTWTSAGGGTLVAVPHSRLASVASVVVDGTTLDAADYTVDLVAGIVYAGTRAAPSRFAAGDVVVTYVVGSGAGSNVWLAARELVRFWWQQGQQVSQRPTFGQQDISEVVASSGYAVPRRVIELLSPNAPAPGMA